MRINKVTERNASAGRFKPRTKFCWQCGNKLASKMTRHGRIYYFALHEDQAGHAHAVHKCCKETLVGEKQITAQEVVRPMNSDEMDALIEDQLGAD